MAESEYNKKVEMLMLAYLNNLISYKKWHKCMEQLIEEKENSFICG